MPARLLVERNADRDIRCRFILIKVDGRIVGSLMFGDHMAIDLEPGRHLVEFDNTWKRKRVELEVHEDEVYAAQVGNETPWLFTFLMSILAAFPTNLFLTLIRVDPFEKNGDGERYLG